MRRILRGLVPLPRQLFRGLILVAAIANGLGNVAMFLFYRPLLEFAGAPPPSELGNFYAVLAFSFTNGVLAFLVFLNPERNRALLVVGAVGKGLYAAVTFYAWLFENLHPFYLAFGAFDFAYTVIFLLFLIQLVSPDLARYQRGDVMAALDRERTNRALMLEFSLTGTGRKALERVRAGLERQGYAVDVKRVVAEESIFRYPMSFADFVRIVVRAIFRRPARIRPLEIAAGHDYDLIVVEAQTWLVGMGAPMEAVFQDSANRCMFDGRDVAVIAVSRGAWRRTHAQLVRWVQLRGGNVVAARGFTHFGPEPQRLFSLWAFLIRGKARYYGLPEASLAELERLGEDLGRRARTRARAAAMEGSAS